VGLASLTSYRIAQLDPLQLKRDKSNEPFSLTVIGVGSLADMSEFDKIADPVDTVDNFKTLACALESKIYLGRAGKVRNLGTGKNNPGYREC
jgi:hypothetical protein